jgi:signal transduction histidine kinase
VKNPSTYSLQAAILLLILAVAVYGIFEFTSGEHQSDSLEPEINQSLERAVSVYDRIYADFAEDSRQLYEEISSLQLTSQNRSHIFSRFERYPFWGISLFHETNRLVWKGHNLSPIPVPLLGDNLGLRVSIQKRNNVVYLFGQHSFRSDDEIYQLLTAKKLELTSNLPFSEQVTFRLSDEPELSGLYPVTFSFFDPVPDDIIYKKLSTERSDSVGVVYATLDDIEQFLQIQQQAQNQWRGLFHLVIFFISFILITIWGLTKSDLINRSLQILTVLFAWIILYQSGIINYWSELITPLAETDMGVTSYGLITYMINSLFLLLLFISFFQFIRNTKPSLPNQLHFRTIIFSLIFGAFSVTLLLFFILSTQEILIQSKIPLLDLELAPDPLSFLFYISSAIFFTAIAGIIISVGYFLYQQEQDKSTFIALGSLFSFVLFYFLTDYFIIAQPVFSWIFLLSIGLFLIFLWLIHSIHKHTHYFIDMSGFRKLMIGVILASASTYFIIYNSSNARMDRELLERAEAFANEEITDTRELLFTLLSEIEGNLLFITSNDIQNREANVQAQFQRAIRNSIRQNWRNHSFEIQLLSPDGDLISDYSTNLDSPGWRSLVDMALMSTSYREQQIRRITNRPIIYERPSNLGENYISFYRGWIPIYDESRVNTIIAWIFAAAYLERPDYNKPMRAVLAAATSDDWKQSYYIAEFADNRVERSAMQGIYNNQPEYNRLPLREAEIANRDSIAFITNITAQGSFREILLKHSDRRVIKASTPLPGFNHHLFSFFRLQIVMVFFGLFIFSILAIFGQKSFSLFGQSRKFKHRLLDGLTLATILFLTVLIFATQFAVGKQNEKNVERELITKLNSLSESLRGEVDLFGGSARSSRLNEFATPLNVDAILYSRANILDSTTPQIFQQHIMPRSMPYPAYDFLYNRERRHYLSTEQIGNETLLIGYRALLDNENTPAGAIAIPTFVQSPVYREQLLETTSYLFGVYLAIFGLFIIGTVFFSNRLTRPLQIIQNGLNKISRGDMKTQVDVTSSDEIGSLAKAYNQMVKRLDATQKELLLAERESAWKEMAQQVAHEIKNPLTPMKLNLQHLQRQLEANPENVMELRPVIEKTAANIIEQIESLNKIASDFSKFSRPVHEPLEPVNLNKLIESVSDLYRNDENTLLEIKQPRRALTILAVEGELRRALINLVKNGIEAHENSVANIRIEVKKRSDQVQISIKDRGEGIADEDHEKIFVPNFSTKSSGTGLGLAITKKIIEAHHGDIRFESKLGSGTTFYISLPLHT